MNRNDLKGNWLEDEFLSFIKGYLRFEATDRDVRQFSIEIDRVGDNMFPLGRHKVYFAIEHPNKIIENDLSNYFLGEYSRYRNGLYGDYFRLGNFFNGIMHQLIIYGESFFATDWEQKQIELRSYILPCDFRYLNTSAMSVKRNSNGLITGYKQQYTPFAKLSYNPSENKIRRFNFEKDEVFYTIYPLEEVHPVKKSMYLIKPILGFWDFLLDKSESNLRRKGLRVIQASLKRYSDEKRKYALARAKVRKNFHYLLNTEDLSISEYYDIFLVTEYLKELNKCRLYFVDEFNKQIFLPFAQKNSLEIPPTLKLIGFMTNKEIDMYFEKYKRKELSSKEFIEQVINKE